jgi:hypothetical protein
MRCQNTYKTSLLTWKLRAWEMHIKSVTFISWITMLENSSMTIWLTKTCLYWDLISHLMLICGLVLIRIRSSRRMYWLASTPRIIKSSYIQPLKALKNAMILVVYLSIQASFSTTRTSWRFICIQLIRVTWPLALITVLSW